MAISVRFGVGKPNADRSADEVGEGACFVGYFGIFRLFSNIFRIKFNQIHSQCLVLVVTHKKSIFQKAQETDSVETNSSSYSG